MESPGALPSAWVGWGLVFQLIYRFHRYWAYSSKSAVWPKMESCFQDRACSVSSFTFKQIMCVPVKMRETWMRRQALPKAPCSW